MDHVVSLLENQKMRTHKYSHGLNLPSSILSCMEVWCNMVKHIMLKCLKYKIVLGNWMPCLRKCQACRVSGGIDVVWHYQSFRGSFKHPFHLKLVSRERTPYIETDWHYVREKLLDGIIVTNSVNFNNRLIDMLRMSLRLKLIVILLEKLSFLMGSWWPTLIPIMIN